MDNIIYVCPTFWYVRGASCNMQMDELAVVTMPYAERYIRLELIPLKIK